MRAFHTWYNGLRFFISAKLTLCGSVDLLLKALILRIDKPGPVMLEGGTSEMDRRCRIEGYQSVYGTRVNLILFFFF